jgi:hypothetical protein
MALLVGNQLPLKLKLPWVLLVAFCLRVVSSSTDRFGCCSVMSGANFMTGMPMHRQRGSQAKQQQQQRTVVWSLQRHACMGLATTTIMRRRWQSNAASVAAAVAAAASGAEGAAAASAVVK